MALVSYTIDPPLYLKYLTATQLFKCAVVCRAWRNATWDVHGDLLRSISVVGATEPQHLCSLFERCTRLRSLDVALLSPQETEECLRRIPTLPFRTSLHTLQTSAIRVEEILEHIINACPRLVNLSIPGSTVRAFPTDRLPR